jgi:hypothetical protein
LVTVLPPVLPTNCTTVGLPGWLLGIVSVPTVIPADGAVNETSTMHQGAVDAGMVAANELPQG